ncbi:MAG: tetratricopeptide repeat protein [Pirellulaceae bacterium]
MSLPLPSHFGLIPGIECEPHPSNRIVFWVPGTREAEFQNWERISSLSGEDVEVNHGVCMVGAMSVPLRESLPGFLTKILRRFKPPTGESWMTPLGAPAVAVAAKRTDILLVWSNSPGDTLDERIVQEHWPAAIDHRRLGSNLFLVKGIAPHQTPFQANKARCEEKRQESGEDYLAELKNNLYRQAELVLATARERRDAAKEAIALTDMGVVLLVHGYPEESIEHLEQALTLFRQQGDEVGEYDALSNLVRPYLSLGRGQEAELILQQLYARARRLGDRPAEQVVLVQMGLTAMGRLEPRQALDHLERASRIARERGDRRGDAFILWNAAICQEELGNRDQALELAQTAVDISREYKMPTAERYAASLEQLRRGEMTLKSDVAVELGNDSTGTWLFDDSLAFALSRPLAKDSPQPASLLQMAYTATRSMVKFASSGFKTISRDTRDDRLDVCRKCEQHTGLRCKICGCFTGAKTWLRHEECPLHKW